MINISVPAANTPVLSGLFIAQTYHLFFNAISARANALSASPVSVVSEDNTQIPATLTNNQVFYCQPTAALTVLTPSAVSVKGVIFHVANKAVPNIYNVTVMPQVGETINGIGAVTVAPGQSKTFVSVGVELITLG